MRYKVVANHSLQKNSAVQSDCRAHNYIAKQTWYADDSAAASSLEQLRRWWDTLSEMGPLYRYFPNDAKTHILAKAQHINKAREVFGDTAMTISEEGKRYLEVQWALPPLSSNSCRGKWKDG